MQSFSALILTALFGVSVFAQNTNGRVIGAVTDPQGAAIAGAKVTVTNTATNLHWDTTTDSAGAYQVLDIPIGKYSVAVEVACFKKTVTNPQELSIDQSLRIDVRLKLGAISETVQVQAEAAQVENPEPNGWRDRRWSSHSGSASQRPQRSGSRIDPTWCRAGARGRLWRRAVYRGRRPRRCR
jgi:hypothetical protein